jgi:hypothetical protein
MGPIRCPETSVKEYYSTLRNTPEYRRSHQHRGGSLKFLHFIFIFINFELSKENGAK